LENESNERHIVADISHLRSELRFVADLCFRAEFIFGYFYQYRRFDIGIGYDFF
jgi:hypothetical protein